MAAPTVTELRVALAAALEPALNGHGGVHAHADGGYVPPVVFVYPRSVDYDNAMARGGDEWELIVRALAQSLDRNGQEFLDGLIDPEGPRSVKALIETDQTLGGLSRGVRVVRMENYQEYVFEGRAPTFGCEFVVFIEADGT